MGLSFIADVVRHYDSEPVCHGTLLHCGRSAALWQWASLSWGMFLISVRPAFVYIFVECTLPRQSPIANRVLHKRQRKLIGVIDRHVRIFLTTYFRTTPMADVNFTSLVTSLITRHHCISFTVALVICKLQHHGIAYCVCFNDADNATCKARVGLPYSVLLVAEQTIFGFAVNVSEAHGYMCAIQSCNMHLYCIVVTSWHCVLHHKLAIKYRNIFKDHHDDDDNGDDDHHRYHHHQWEVERETNWLETVRRLCVVDCCWSPSQSTRWTLRSSRRWLARQPAAAGQ